MLYGDTKGNVTLLHFLDPSTGLFAVSTQDGSSASDKIHLILYSVSSFIYNNQYLFFSLLFVQRLSSHSQYLQVTVVSRVHQDWIQRIMYLPQNHSIITCSITHHNSLVMRDINGRRKPYVFNLLKVLCMR